MHFFFNYKVELVYYSSTIKSFQYDLLFVRFNYHFYSSVKNYTHSVYDIARFEEVRVILEVNILEAERKSVDCFPVRVFEVWDLSEASTKEHLNIVVVFEMDLVSQ